MSRAKLPPCRSAPRFGAARRHRQRGWRGRRAGESTHQARGAMVLEELAGELVGLEFQFRHQVVPSRAGWVRRGLRHGVGRRGIGRRPRSDLRGLNGFRAGHGWVALKAEKLPSQLAALAAAERMRSRGNIFRGNVGDSAMSSEPRAQLGLHGSDGLTCAQPRRLPGCPTEWSVLRSLAQGHVARPDDGKPVRKREIRPDRSSSPRKVSRSIPILSSFQEEKMPRSRDLTPR
jgi:hypothetical protein